MITINEIHLHLMNNGSHYMFVSHVLEQAEACTALGTKAAAYLAELRKAVAAEDAVLKISTKSKLSDGIAEADASRDALYLGFKNVVKGFLLAPSAEVKQAAMDLNQLLVDYRIDPRAPMIKETGMMKNFLADLETKFKAQVETLGLTVLVGQMRESNGRVDKLMVQRTEERKDVVTGQLKAARVVTDEAYRELVKMVNGLVYVEGEAGYLDFVKYVNAEILYYRREAMGQKGSAPKGDGSNPEAGGGTGGTENPGGSTGGSGGDDNLGGSDFD